MNNSFGLIYAGESGMHLKDLTLERALAAVPFGGRYRIIDFSLSNLVNSGIVNVGVITHNNYNSLMQHLSSGQPWDLARKRGGLTLLPPFVAAGSLALYRGSVDAIRASFDYMRNIPNRYCVFMDCDLLFNMSFRDAMAQHLASGADVTMIYNVESGTNDERSNNVRLLLSERSRVTDMEIGSYRPTSVNQSMNCFIIDKSLLEYLVEEASSRGYTDFVRDVLFRKLGTLKVHAYRHTGYVARMSSVQAYFDSNMDLLTTVVRQDLFFGEGRIYTRVMDEAPAKYLSTASVKNCMVSDGCLIAGDIENCILFRGVHIARGAKLKNCIVMQGADIQESATLENVILDKHVLVKQDRHLSGHETYPVIIRKGAII